MDTVNNTNSRAEIHKKKSASKNTRGAETVICGLHNSRYPEYQVFDVTSCV